MAASRPKPTMEEITALAKRRGFIFQSSEIYGGINGAWDYGPVGVELKRNVREAWWREIVALRDDVVGVDTAIFMAPRGMARIGARREFSRPDGRLQDLQETFPRRPDHRRSLPVVRQPDAHGAARVQHDVQDVHRRDGRRVVGSVFAARNRAGHFRRFQARRIRPRARSRPSASRRSARRFATR